MFIKIFLPFVAIVVVLSVIVWAVDRVRRLASANMFGMSREDVKVRWAKIEAMVDEGVMGQKLAILEADNLLDSIFKSQAMPGNTLGERLKVACARKPELRRVWWAHKLRNQIAHDSSFSMKRGEAKRALKEFERAFKKLGVL